MLPNLQIMLHLLSNQIALTKWPKLVNHDYIQAQPNLNGSVEFSPASLNPLPIPTESPTNLFLSDNPVSFLKESTNQAVHSITIYCAKQFIYVIRMKIWQKRFSS